MSREKTSVLVKVVDLSSIEEKIRVHFSSVINSPRCIKVINIFFRGKIGLVGTPKGTYVVNEKGSGIIDTIISGRPYIFNADVHFMNEHSLEHFIRHFGPIACPLSKLQGFKVIKIMNLADFILPGQKRDKNYQVWKEILEGSPSPLFD